MWYGSRSPIGRSIPKTLTGASRGRLRTPCPPRSPCLFVSARPTALCQNRPPYSFHFKELEIPLLLLLPCIHLLNDYPYKLLYSTRLGKLVVSLDGTHL